MTEKEFTEMAASLRSLALRCGRRCAGDDGAEDIAQDTMLRLWGLRGELSSADHARKLAVTIARHLAIDRLRGSAPLPLEALQGASVADTMPAPDARLEEEQNWQWLRRYLGRLPPKEYMVLRLRQEEMRSAEEIAAILGIRPASVPVLLSRARHKLFEALRKR